MPAPVSVTCAARMFLSSSKAIYILIYPPAFVNFNAFLMRLIKTCCRRRVSPIRSGGKTEVSCFLIKIRLYTPSQTVNYLTTRGTSSTLYIRAFMLKILTMKSRTSWGLNFSLAISILFRDNSRRLSKSSTKEPMKISWQKTKSVSSFTWSSSSLLTV